jgi:hypothetical protein
MSIKGVACLDFTLVGNETVPDRRTIEPNLGYDVSLLKRVDLIVQGLGFVQYNTSTFKLFASLKYHPLSLPVSRFLLSRPEFKMFPSISEHNVSRTSGFLPPVPPLRSLPTYYKSWDNLVAHLSESIADKTLRSQVANLPVLSTSSLTSLEQLHRAFVVLGFLVHGYVWCDGSENPEPTVPAQLGQPYLEICDRLGMQTTLSYAGLCLWNWQIREYSGMNGHLANGSAVQNGHCTESEMHSRVKNALKNLDELDCLASFTGSRDEAVFYPSW